MKNQSKSRTKLAQKERAPWRVSKSVIKMVENWANLYNISPSSLVEIWLRDTFREESKIKSPQPSELDIKAATLKAKQEMGCEPLTLEDMILKDCGPKTYVEYMKRISSIYKEKNDEKLKQYIKQTHSEDASEDTPDIP